MHSSRADRNLLFGILAMQMDFISREDLITATTVWITDKQRRLDEILVAQGMLPEDERELLAALVDKHLEKHGHDVRKSLESISVVSSGLREELSRLADPEVEASMGHVSVARDSRDDFATQSFTIGDATSTGKRFRVLRPHAKGGLGQISVAIDEELNREVALKEIQPEHADEAISRERFVREAEVTGALEHPGIVPVYGLGQYADGRPFYAMRFIRGDSLREAIARFHNESEAGRDAGERQFELRQLLGRFVDVCNAIEYAHSRGVLHRDLKPGNIMLGKYGETLVVDWGLAKLVDRPDTGGELEEPTVRPSSGSGGGQTLQGRAIGTPSYMSPEQAVGRLDLVGRQSDVYSLGATLYTLLTGQPPFDPTDDEILTKVQRGQFESPRAVLPGIPQPLEAICLKAMAREPKERYATPEDLASDIERYLADEPIMAARDPLSARIARWARQHRAAVMSSTAALVIATVSLGVTTVLLNIQKQAETKAKEAEAQARQEADASSDRAKRAREEANANLAVAEKARAEADANYSAAQERLALSLTNSGVTAVQGKDYAAAMRLFAEAVVTRESLPNATPDVANRMRYALADTLLPQLVGPLESVPVEGLKLLEAKFSADGTFLAGIVGNPEQRVTPDSKQHLVVWETGSGKQRFRREFPGRVISIDLRPDGKWLACDCEPPPRLPTESGGSSMPGSQTARQRFWLIDAETGNEVALPGVRRVFGVTFDPMNRWFIVRAESDNQADACQLCSIDNTQCMALGPAGRMAMFLSGNRLLLMEQKGWVIRDLEKIHEGGIVQPRHIVFEMAGWSEMRTPRCFSTPRGDLVYACDFPNFPSGPSWGTIWSAGSKRSSSVSLPGVPVGRNCDGRWFLVDSGSGSPRTRGAMAGVVSMGSWPADGSRKSTEDARFRVWSTERRDFSDYELPAIKEVSFASPDGRFLVSAANGQYLLWTAAAKTPHLPVIEHNGPISALAFDKSGDKILTASWDNSGRLSDVAGDRSESVELLHAGIVNDAVWCFDGECVATAGADQSLGVWTATGARKFERRFPGSVNCLAADAGWLVAGAEDGHVVVLTQNAQTAEIVSALDLTVNDSVTCVAINTAKGAIAAGCADGALFVWDVSSTPLQSPRVLQDSSYVAAVQFADDGRRMVVGRGDGTIQIYDTGGMVEVANHRHFDAITCMAIEPSGQYVVTTSRDRTTRVWGVRSGQPVSEPMPLAAPALCAAMDPLGRWFATGDASGKVLLWECPSGASLGTGFDCGNEVRRAAFDGTSRVLAAACSDGTVHTWLLPCPTATPNQGFRQAACRRTSTDLDASNTPRSIEVAVLPSEAPGRDESGGSRIDASASQLCLNWARHHLEGGNWDDAWNSAMHAIDEGAGLSRAQPLLHAAQYGRLWYGRRSLGSESRVEPVHALSSVDIEYTMDGFSGQVFAALTSDTSLEAIRDYRSKYDTVDVPGQHAEGSSSGPISGRVYDLVESSNNAAMTGILSRHVRPDTWDSAGGAGKAVLDTKRRKLFVAQSREALDAVGWILGSLATPVVDDALMSPEDNGEFHGVYRAPPYVLQLSLPGLERLLSTGPELPMRIDYWKGADAVIVTGDASEHKRFAQFLAEVAIAQNGSPSIAPFADRWWSKIDLQLDNVPINDLASTLTKVSGFTVHVHEAPTEGTQPNAPAPAVRLSVSLKQISVEAAMRCVCQCLADFPCYGDASVQVADDGLHIYLGKVELPQDRWSCRAYDITKLCGEPGHVQEIAQLVLPFSRDFDDYAVMGGGMGGMGALYDLELASDVTTRGVLAFAMDPGQSETLMAVVTSDDRHAAILDMLTQMVRTSTNQDSDSGLIEDRALAERMNQPITFSAKDEPLTSVASRIEEMTGIPVSIDEKALNDIGLGNDTPVTAECSGVRLRSALRDIILGPLDLDCGFSEDGIRITTPEELEEELVTHFYPVGDVVTSAEADDEMLKLVTSTIRPETWEDVGGAGAIWLVGQSRIMVVSQTQDVCVEVNDLVTALKKLQGVEPIPLLRYPTPRTRERLSSPISLNAGDYALDDFVGRVSSQSQLTMNIDKKALDDVGIGCDTLCHLPALDGVPAQTVLEQVLGDVDLTYLRREDFVVITTPEDADSNQETVLYPVHELARDGVHINKLVDAVAICMAPDTWEGVGGAGAIEPVDFVQCVAVSHVREIQDDFSYVLDVLRGAPLADDEIVREADTFFGQSFPWEQFFPGEVSKEKGGAESTDASSDAESLLTLQRFIAGLTTRFGGKLAKDVRGLGKEDANSPAYAASDLRNETWGNVLQRLELDWYVRQGRIRICDQSDWPWNIFRVGAMTSEDVARMTKQIQDGAENNAVAAEEPYSDNVFLLHGHLLVSQTAETQRRTREWLRNAGFIQAPAPAPATSR